MEKKENKQFTCSWFLNDWRFCLVKVFLSLKINPVD